MASRVEMLKRNKKFLLLASILVSIVAISVIGPHFTKNPTHRYEIEANPPSSDYILGTTYLGYPVFPRLLHGIQMSLMIALVAGSIALVGALLIGGFSGYYSGLRGESLNVLQTMFLMIPIIPIILVLTALFEHRTIWVVTLVVALVSWAWSGRQFRSQVLSLKERNFVDLARISGKGDFDILFREIFPNMLGFVVVSLFNIMGSVIVIESSISAIGLGPETAVTLGTMINRAITHSAMYKELWWWFIPPGIVIILITGTLVALASVIDDVLNPRLRGY